MPAELPQVYLARHGETQWALSGQHTGRTDVSLTAHGEVQARALGARIADLTFDRVWSSPRLRARTTAELTGLGSRVEVVPDLAEWDYGIYEGLTSDQIHAENPGWLIYRDGCPQGESPAAVSARADRVVARLRGEPGRTLLFGHGHFSRILAVRWLGLPILDGQYFKIGPAALGCVSYEHDLTEPVIELWNDHRHAQT